MAAGRHLGTLKRHRAVSLQQHGFLVIICGPVWYETETRTRQTTGKG